MEAALSKFQQQLQSLKTLIGYYEVEQQLQGEFQLDPSKPIDALLNDLSIRFKEFHVIKREFNYNSLIISLYGYFERFIENTLIDYADQINRVIPRYSKLPKKIGESHYHLSLSLLGKLDHARYAGTINKEDIIGKLHACLNDDEPYQFIIDAFTQHGANFKHDVIDDFFGRVGISDIGQLVMDDRKFFEYTQTRLGLEAPDKIYKEQGFDLMDDLAQRRNDVAHGVPAILLRNDIIAEYVGFFGQYSDALIRVCQAALQPHTVVEVLEALGVVKEIFSSGYVVCLESNGVALEVGDTLRSEGVLKNIEGTVISIMVDGIETQKIDAGTNIYVGLRLDIKGSKRFTLSKLTYKPIN